jgi:hypothetical protein
VRTEGGSALEDEAGKEFTWTDGEAFSFGAESSERRGVDPEVDWDGGAFFAWHREREKGWMMICQQL